MSDRSQEGLLTQQAQVLERIVRGERLEDVLSALCTIVEAQSEPGVRVSILLVDGDRLVTGGAGALPAEYCRAIDGVPVQVGFGTCADAAARGTVVVTPDIDAAPGWATIKSLPLDLGLVAAWSMPIMSSTNEVLGTFGSYFPTKRAPTEAETQLVQVLARTAALAIERNRLDSALRAHAGRQRFLADLQKATQSLVEPAAIMATSARTVAEYLDVDRCAYAEIEDERIFVITGDYPRNGVPSITGRWDVAAFGAACARAMAEGTPLIIDDVATDPRLDPADHAGYVAAHIRSVVCVPLHKEGRFTAAMAVHRTTPHHWTPAEIALVTMVTAHCWETLERARVTRDLRESESHYRAIVEATPDCVKVLAADGRLLRMNAAGLRMLEASSDADVIGTNVFDIVAPEDRERFRAFHEQVCNGQPGSLSYDIVGLRGTRRSMETAAVPLVGPDGRPAHLGVTRDVSARVASERALAMSRARLEYAVRLSGVGFWYCDLPFDELQWDSRVKDHFFLPPDARVTIETFYDRIHPDDREPTRLAIDGSISSFKTYDTTYRTVDPATGAIKFIRALGGAAYGPDGAPTHFDGVTVDVTAQKADEQRYREQDRLKDEFLAMLAHELRNPLAPVRTGIHLLQVGAAPERTEQTLAMMDRHIGHLVHLVDDLLDISRITLGKITLKTERLDLRDVLANAIETTRAFVEASAHAVSVNVPDAPIAIDGDPTRLSQIFSNLIHNAAKYTPDGGRISIGVELVDGTAKVRVSDTGVGIPSEMLPTVFDMFTQVGRSLDRAQGGLGIGLTLVRRLVELHEGTVVAESSGAGAGSTFTVTLPLAATDAVTIAPRVPRSEPVSGLTILVVDDNVDAAEMLAMLLEHHGNTTRLAHSGPDALAVAEELSPDIIFLDIGLPGLDGFEVARKLRERESRALIIAVTGWGSEEHRRRAQDAGFDIHLVKPIDGRKLADVLVAVQR